jgi:dihydrolipoamide dehydrogenase
MVPDTEVDIAIIGAGPGGYVAAIRAAQLGMRVVLIEREAVGGVCLNWGCIPAKALLRSAEILDLVRRASEFGIEVQAVSVHLDAAVDRSNQVVSQAVRGVEYLLNRHGVEVIRGSARLERPNLIRVEPSNHAVRATHTIIATGARPHSPWPVSGDRVMTSREALARRDSPGRLVVIGGGCVGVELAEVYASLGGPVTLIERHDSLLPDFDRDLARPLQQSLERRGVTVRTSSSVRQLREHNDRVVVEIDSPGGTATVEADCALVALGITPNTDGLGLEDMGVELSDRGFIATGPMCETNVRGIYAIGDVTGRLPLAHVAFAQGMIAVEAIAGRSPRPLDYDAVARAVYTHPQVASVGLSEEEARARGRDVAVGRFPFTASGCAIALGETTGLTKIVVDRSTGEIVGSHIVGESAAELIHEIALGRTLETTAAEIVNTVHAHPTLAEAIREAALDVTGDAIHFFRERAL